MRLIRRDADRGYIDSMFWVPKKHFNVEGVKRALTFELPGRDVTRVLTLWEEAEHHLVVPRSFWKPSDLPFECIDCRPRTFVKTGVRSRIHLDHKPDPVTGQLKPTGKATQRNALRALLSSMGGTLQLACGKGKTVVALEFSAQRQVPTLIVVDNTHLLKQWQGEIEKFLDVPGGVGLIAEGKKDWKRSVVMATYQSLALWAATMPEEVRRWFGLVVWDEGHHVNAPTFSKSAPLFYGYRLALSATPDRTDGMHVICQHHVGDIIYKDVVQDKPPSIYFRWTGYELDLKEPAIRDSVCDVNGEVHFGRIAGHFGSDRKRLTGVVLDEVQNLVGQGHKVLVLSYSVNEVMNLMAIWTSNDPDCPLYTDIPYPTKEEVGETAEPVAFDKKHVKRLTTAIADIEKNLRINHGLNPAKRLSFQNRINEYKAKLEAYRVWKKTESLFRKRQRAFLKDLLSKKSTAGLFTYDVGAEDRMQMLRERQVIFAIMKYGKEGLDDKNLSAIIMSEPVSDRNILQQVMGRPRDKDNATLVILEDNIGPLIGQCTKLRKHLREWNVDEGGPFKYDLIGHPAVARRRTGWTTTPRALRVPASSS